MKNYRQHHTNKGNFPVVQSNIPLMQIYLPDVHIDISTEQINYQFRQSIYLLRP